MRESGREEEKSWSSPILKVQRKFFFSFSFLSGERVRQSYYVPQGFSVSGNGGFKWEGRSSGPRGLSLAAVGRLAPQFELLGE